MANYLITRNGTPEYYFHSHYEGICMKRRRFQGIWQESVQINENGKDCFGVFSSSDGLVHLISTDSENKLIYSVNDGKDWKKYIISKLNSDIHILQMKLFSIRGRLNLMYSAIYNGETLLVHCILGDRAKPSTVDIIETSDFSILEEKAYYTNSNGTLGYVALSDEKPSSFTPLFENAHFEGALKIGEKEKILFTRDGKVFLDGTEILSDNMMQSPIITKCKDKYYIMWKSGSFVKYITSNDGENFSYPMRFMSTGSQMTLYTVQKENGFLNYYGYQTAKDIVLLGNPNIFEEKLHSEISSDSELQKIKSLLNETRSDMVDTKKELERLGKLIGSLSDRY